jgi:anti-sigma factor RsiW
MKCEEVRTLLDAFADDELDLVNHLQIEQHLKDCDACEQMHRNIVAVRSALADESMFYRAPAGLQDRIRTSAKQNDRQTPTAFGWNWRWIPSLAVAGLLVAVVATALVFFWQRGSRTDLLATEVVSSHVRSLMVSHLTDVPSSDQHTVKPWYEGKLDFSPPVVDLGPQGFTLVGGRLDYLAGRPVAALVYQRRQHVINLFIFPDQGDAVSGGGTLVRQGYNLIHWNRSGMIFWAVSDLNMSELQEFSQLLQN